MFVKMIIKIVKNSRALGREILENHTRSFLCSKIDHTHPFTYYALFLRLRTSGPSLIILRITSEVETPFDLFVYLMIPISLGTI